MSFYVWKLESLCPCCKDTTPNVCGITRCDNLRVVKHRIIQSNKTPVFIRRNAKLYGIARISRNMDYESAYTLACLENDH